MTEAKYNLFTDYNQFIVFDSRAQWGNDLWTDQELEDMFIQGDGTSPVGTNHRFYAPVIVRVLEVMLPTSRRTKPSEEPFPSPVECLKSLALRTTG